MRTVVISGASSGIGHATAERFAAAGDHVVNLDTRPPTAPTRPTVRWIETDVRDWTAVDRAVDDVQARHGRLDVAIANAGVSVRRPIAELTEAQARHVIETNLLGVLALWRSAARHMVRQKSGTLLATSSVNGSRGFPLYADYNASKAGVSALCRTFAVELSPHVRAACVSPGAVLTPMQEAEYTPEMLRAVNRHIPAGRHADTREIAEAFFYLASDQARFMTGQELVLDGGETAGSTTSVLARGGFGGPGAPARTTD
ncbi:SDR family oxidoreductase [Streptomyces sp. WAC07149]|uniref:SDR family NAD(P)-dependent oxidoreductase n=1 Tax=Streptomyces sp. WAC07149 TaxID=2487425 RepID=UPI000F784A58|nr:SDR family oxidoreductase [Streptomyces sp. WAC07149]RST08705.1 SDR family oxidoreductase [Streptomyces sp. WAC07149]